MAIKVAIVGKAGTYRLAPFLDPEWRCWGMPWIKYTAGTIDLLFDIHSDDFWQETKERRELEAEFGPRCLGYYKDVTAIIDPSRSYRHRHWTPYPLEEVRSAAWHCPLENSIAYMLAFAYLHRSDIDEVALYGVHMRGAVEYEEERASVLYWIGMLEGAGVHVHVPEGAPLFMSIWEAGRYGLSGKKRMINPFMGGIGATSDINRNLSER